MNLNIIFIVVVLGALLLFFVYSINKFIFRIKLDLQEANKKNNDTNTKLTELTELIDVQKNVILSQRSEINTQNIGITRLQDNTTKIESQKKSSEVRLGQMAENFMPFIRDYPYNHKQFRFLANPVDGIQVTDDAVIFIEFKTGGAKLSKSQKHIKDLVASGSVRFETFRVNETGSHLKLESSMPDVDVIA